MFKNYLKTALRNLKRNKSYAMISDEWIKLIIHYSSLMTDKRKTYD